MWYSSQLLNFIIFTGFPNCGGAGGTGGSPCRRQWARWAFRGSPESQSDHGDILLFQFAPGVGKFGCRLFIISTPAPTAQCPPCGHHQIIRYVLSCMPSVFKFEGAELIGCRFLPVILCADSIQLIWPWFESPKLRQIIDLKKLKVPTLEKVCQNSNFCYIQWSKPNQIKLPYEIMDKDLLCINSANASSIADVTLMYCDYDPLCVLINQIIQKFCASHWKLTPYAACLEQMLWIFLQKLGDRNELSLCRLLS